MILGDGWLPGKSENCLLFKIPNLTNLRYTISTCITTGKKITAGTLDVFQRRQNRKKICSAKQTNSSKVTILSRCDKIFALI